MAGNANYFKESDLRRIGRILDDMRKEERSEALTVMMENLDRYKNGKSAPTIQPLSLYLDVLEIIRESRVSAAVCRSLINNAEVIYENLFPLGENTPQFEANAEIFRLLAGENGLAMKGFFDASLFASFTDKSHYLTLIQMIAVQKQANKIFDKVSSYALEVREYFYDDIGYLTHLLKIVAKLSESSPDAYDQVTEQELLHVRRSNGVYDIDPVRLAQVEKNVKQAALTVENGKNALQMLERKSNSIIQLTEEMDDLSKEILASTKSFLDNQVDNAKSRIDEVLKEYEEKQKQSIHLEKEIFLKQVFSDAESEMTKYRSMAKAITATASADVAAISREAGSVIERLKDATVNDEKLRKIAEKSLKNEELLSKIDKLSLLNDTMIEKLGQEVAKAAQGMTPPPAEPGKPPVGGPGKPGEPMPPAGPVPPMAPPPHGPARHGDRPMPAINPLLDRSVPFKQRFEMVQKEKARRMKQGELFHEMFDDVITAVMEDVNPYLIGPSGCGKTYMVQQIGELLGIDCSDIGYINEEYDILGYVTAMGDYSESNFYWLYKYGGIAFCDELDNGNSKATVKLNSFLTNQPNASYCFPGGERVQKHGNFRVIAAGNTDGRGADVNYSTRERIEESVQQRMIPIYVTYDNRVEQAILKQYPEWFDFCVAFRFATDRWSEVSGIPAQGIFTTRDAFRIKQYLDNGSFTPEKIMQYEFVQTKEPEYLAFLKDEIAGRLKKTSAAYQIYQIFATEVDQVRKKGKRV
ncbi:MAG: AAA family ATPase [Acetatifactor sp.]|nr:AAA family ATPase [Acetatifactor sp.]